jgi:uncharacterized MAPEG superfamily protein
MTITVKTTTAQTLEPGPLAEALANSDPRDVAQFFQGFFDRVHRDEKNADAIAAAFIPHGLADRFEKFNRLVAAHEWKAKQPQS